MRKISMPPLRPFLHRFVRAEKGSVSVETIVMFPMLIWGLCAIYVYWDAYRIINTVQKAAYTISDLISRSNGDIEPAFIDGMQTTLNYLLDADQAGNIRVTSYSWSAERSRYEVLFSRSTSSTMRPLNNGNLAMLHDRLPDMSDLDAAVLLEVAVPYVPALNFGLAPRTISQFIVTRPRYLPKLCLKNTDCEPSTN
jgi:hypothetical protein